jgi:hypothetical protein
MKRWKKVVLALLAVVCLAAGIAAYQNRHNIAAVYTVATTDSETIEASIEQKRDEHKQTIQDQTSVTVAVEAPTLQQSNDLLSGAVTPEQVKEELGITSQLEKVTASGTSTDGAASSEDSASVPTEEDLVNSCVAELYSCQVDLMAQLSVLKQNAINQWQALSQEERTSAKKTEIGMAGLSACYRLEVSVDSEVKSILARYRTELEKIHGDTSILNTLWDMYVDEKTSQKAYYLDKYLK